MRRSMPFARVRTKSSPLELAPACPYCGMVWDEADMKEDLEEGDSVILECSSCEGETRLHRLRYKYTTHTLH